MLQILTVFYNVLTPVILVTGLGFFADRRFSFNTRSISQLVVYLAVPALVFSSIGQSNLQAQELGQLTLFTFTAMGLISGVGWVLGSLLKLPKKTRSAFTLSSTLINAGNFGIPFATFAFGDAGLGQAVIIYTATAIMANTLGVFLASWGSASIKKSLLNVFRVPLPYAALLGLLTNQGIFSTPQPIMRGLTLLGNAAVPLMLIMLGVQLSRTQIRDQVGLVFLSSIVRVLIGPAVALLVVGLFGITGLSAKVAILQIGMPTAVISIILAEEFGSDSKFVGSVIMVSTLLSFVSLSALLAFL